MEYKSIILDYNNQIIDKVVKHYHFLSQDITKLDALYRATLPLLQVEAFYIWNPILDKSKHRLGMQFDEKQALVFLTLGKGFDQLQDVYVDGKCLQEAYMLECIGLELLTEAYEEFVKMIQKETNQWAIKMDFLGDDYPIEELPNLYSQVKQQGENLSMPAISYTEQFLLNPKKSVVFFLPMSDVKVEKNPCHICEQCKNVECIFRQEKQEARKEKQTGFQIRKPANTYSYGYQQMFGEKSKK